MRNKITTIILTIVLIVLVTGSVILGMAIYRDIVGTNSEDIIYQIGNIITEEPKEKEDKNLNIANQGISGTAQANIANNANTVQGDKSNTDITINRFFYNQLVENQKIIYDKLFENKDKLKQGTYKIDFKETFSKMLSDEDGSKRLGQDYQTAIEAFMHDNPDLFYIDVNKMYLNIKTTTKFLTTKNEVFISAKDGETYLSDEFQDLEQINAAINEIEKVKNKIINDLPESDYDKIMKIHDYLVDTIEYDSTYQAIGSYGIYGALIGKTCVCEGYAKSLKYLANAAGIKCEIMQGTATNSSGKTESHAWNCVKINGIWYEIDPTWDDPIIVGSGYKTNVFKYKYFLKGSNTFEKDHILSNQFSQNGKEFEYPIISKRDY